jgi:hypothetical protein
MPPMPAPLQTVGAVWAPQKQRVRDGCETEFRFPITYAGSTDNGADGFGFVLQK